MTLQRQRGSEEGTTLSTWEGGSEEEGAEEKGAGLAPPPFNDRRGARLSWALGRGTSGGAFAIPVYIPSEPEQKKKKGGIGGKTEKLFCLFYCFVGAPCRSSCVDLVVLVCVLAFGLI